MMSGNVISWWACLCGVAAFNVVAWGWAALLLARRKVELQPEAYAVRRLQLVLSAVYVLGCAFRSVMPVYDIPRLALLDSSWSSALIGRSVATCAELSFVAQWALLLHTTHRSTGNSMAWLASRLVLPLIVIAELCSWYSVLTTANIGHVAEESLWGVAAALLVASVVSLLPQSAVQWRPILFMAGITGLAYVTYMFVVDVPMYWTRWLADQAHGRHYLSLAQGVLDAGQRRVISYRWSDWKSEVVWMSSYFSVAVWLSIALIHAPTPVLVTAGERQARPASPSFIYALQTISRRRR